MSYFSSQKDKYRVFAVGETNIYLTLKELVDLESMGIHVLKAINGFSLLNIYSTTLTILRLRQYIAKYRIDIVHAFVATPFALWLNFLGTKYVITTRGTDVLITLPNLKSKKVFNIKDKILFLLFKRSFKNASLVTCTSMSQIESVRRMFKVKHLELIRTGVNVHEINSLTYCSGYLPNQKYVLFPRYLNNPNYNVELQIESIKKLPKVIIEDYIFIFIKKDGYMDDFSKKIQFELESLKSKISLKYLVFDYLGQADLWSLYKNASLVVMTPLSDGTPNSALETMSAKCPLILPNLKYDDDLFNETCIKLETYDSSELARNIERALYEYPENYIFKAYDNVQNYGNRLVEMTRLSKHYDEILKF